MLALPGNVGDMHCAAATVLWASVDGSAAANDSWREQGKAYLGGDDVMTGGHDFDFPCNVSEDGVVHCPA